MDIVDSILDTERIEAITPLFKFYHLQDILENLKQQLVNIRNKQRQIVSSFNRYTGDKIINSYTYNFIMGKWTVEFDSEFDKLCIDTKEFLIKKFQIKYPWFDKVIKREAMKKKNDFPWYIKKKPMDVLIKKGDIDKDALRFVAKTFSYPEISFDIFVGIKKDKDAIRFIYSGSFGVDLCF